jgi:hypothetical protein
LNGPDNRCCHKFEAIGCPLFAGLLVSRVNTIIRNTKICISNNCKTDRVMNTPIPLLIRGFQNFSKERMAGRTTDIFPSHMAWSLLSANKKYRHCFILGGKALIPGIFGLFKRLGKTEMSEMQIFAFPTFIKGYMPVFRPCKGIYRKKTIRPPRHIVFKYFYMRTIHLISINPDAWRAFFLPVGR